MSIRLVVLVCLVVVLILYAWKDWFVSLCGLVVLMAAVEHPDMPKNIMGIQGLNPWNLVMAVVLLAWLGNRRREHLVWDMPRPISVLLLLQLGVVLVGFARMMLNPLGFEEMGLGGLVSEDLINCVKWVVPGLLFFDGCRSQKRLMLGTASVLALLFLLALEVIRYIPFSAALNGSSMNALVLRLIQKQTGYSRVTMSTLLCGASWAILAFMPLLKHNWQKALLVLAIVLTVYAQALTGGRMSYVAWALTGLIMCLLRWRRLLLVAPLVPIAIGIAMPGVVDRMLDGFGAVDAAGETVVNEAAVTSNRALIWPVVIDKIMESPLLGFGREAMTTTGLSADPAALGFPHPHNAYLEWLLDNGLIGFLLVMPFYGVIVWKSAVLFRSVRRPLASAIGGVCLALTLTLLFSAFASQSFYPREGSVAFWASIGLMLRVSLYPATAPARVASAGARQPGSPAHGFYGGRRPCATPSPRILRGS